MEYLQYTKKEVKELPNIIQGFKPCYKWNTFNTLTTDPILFK